MSNAYASPRPAKLVCLTCRANNIRCEPSPHAPSVACSRCTRKGLMCQYVPAGSPAPTSHAHSSSNASRSYMVQPELPYTGPPPMNLRPRYSGGAYPNLSLAGQASPAPAGGYAPNSTAQYPNTAHSGNAYPNTAANGYAYYNSCG